MKEESTKIHGLRAAISKWLSIPDEDAEVIDFIIAVYKSHGIPGDPIWAQFVDASGGGKTELLRTLKNRPNCYFLSKISENSLISGYREPGKSTKDPSLLPLLNEKVLIIKDLAPLLQMRAESRNVIFSQLRDAYDGFTSEGKGNIGRVEYSSRFTLLAATTLSIDREDTMQQELGERFVKFRARGDGRIAKTRKAMENIGKDGDMRKEIEDAVCDFLDALGSATEVRVPELMIDKLTQLADFVSAARSPVPRDRRGDILYHPKPEVGVERQCGLRTRRSKACTRQHQKR